MKLDHNGLLEALHEGAFEQPLWRGFLDRLRAVTGSAHVLFILRNPQEGAVIDLAAGEDAPADLRGLFPADGATREPVGQHMREGRVYARRDLFDGGGGGSGSEDGEGDGADSIDLRCIRATEADGVDAWLVCAGGRAAAPAVGALLVSLAPHLRIALRAFVALERERFRSTVASEAFGRLNFGWLTLDAACRIMDTTPHVDRLLERTSILRRGRYDRIVPASPAVDRELTALVKSYAQDGEGRSRAIKLSRDPLIDMLVAPFRDLSVPTARKPVAIVYLSGDRRSQADRCEQLGELFGLLPSEARLAWAIAGGLSIAEAARDLGITVETARNYSKKVYAKTGARGQAELVRNVLTSVLAIA